MRDLENIRKDIERARRYMLNRFPVYVNEEETPTGVFNQPRFEVTFPDVDACRVVPVMLFGMKVEKGAAVYRLAWKNGKPIWVGNFELRILVFNEGPIISYEVPDE